MIQTAFDTPFRNQQFGFGSYLLNGLHLGLREAARPLPYAARMALARRVGRAGLALNGEYRRRIAENLALIYPETTASWRRDVTAEVGGAIGQTLMEHMSMAAFAAGAVRLHLDGPGLAALDPARGALLVTGHFGQWEGVRLGWRRVTGSDCGFFYRPQNNGFWDRHWQRYLAAAGMPLIPKGGPGKAQMAAHLSARQPLLMVIDQALRSAERLDFMGQPARTPLTAAALALHYDVPMIPAFSVRRSSGTAFDVWFGEPISAGSSTEMTQVFNDLLGDAVRSAPGQYLWTHRRWR